MMFVIDSRNATEFVTLPERPFERLVERRRSRRRSRASPRLRWRSRSRRPRWGEGCGHPFEARAGSGRLGRRVALNESTRPAARRILLSKGQSSDAARTDGCVTWRRGGHATDRGKSSNRSTRQDKYPYPPSGFTARATSPSWLRSSVALDRPESPCGPAPTGAVNSGANFSLSRRSCTRAREVRALIFDVARRHIRVRVTVFEVSTRTRGRSDGERPGSSNGRLSSCVSRRALRCRVISTSIPEPTRLSPGPFRPIRGGSVWLCWSPAIVSAWRAAARAISGSFLRSWLEPF